MKDIFLKQFTITFFYKTLTIFFNLYKNAKVTYSFFFNNKVTYNSK